jgi:glycosidase
MPVNIEPIAPDTLSTANLLVPRGPVFPSPADWRDQVLYFLLPDRFSDGREGTRPIFDRGNPGRFRAPNKAQWMAAGKGFQGGTVDGIRSQLPYLKGLGVTALWLGPTFRQRKDLDTYHGYGIQDFLDVDPRFGTRQDLRNLIDEAHVQGMYVLLDIIYNHTGNNWSYDENGQPRSSLPYRYSPPYPMDGWRSGTGQSTNVIQDRDDGVHPKEFQNEEWYTRAGQIGKFDPESWENPLDPRNEFRRGDFFDLKDLKLNEYEAPSGDVLNALIKVYRYWIALTDCDGFRVDTVKHVSFEASRNFCGAIHEFAESIGKENFLILGEVTGGAEMSRSYLDIFGRNLDAAIDLGEPMDILSGFVKGLADPMAFFRQFGGHDALGGHRQVGRYHVSMVDDHDMISRNPKRRFSAENTSPERYQQAAHAVGVQLTTLGIPCIYYGTEQALDGWEGYHDLTIEGLGSDGKIPFRDRYIREAMFGGTFGAFGTAGCHFFDPDHPTYLRIGAIGKVVGRTDIIGKALRRGRQYSRDVRFDGQGFLPPRKGELVAWSRILFEQEVVIALNTNGLQRKGGDVAVEGRLHPAGSKLKVVYRSDWTDAQLKNPPAGTTANVVLVDGRETVRIDLPPAGMAILG